MIKIGKRGKGWHGESQRHSEAAKKSKQKKRSLFTPAKHKKYGLIVKIDSTESAKKSVKTLENEFDGATKSKKLRVAQVTQRAANVARASAKRKSLSAEKKREFIEVAEIYDKTAKKMWKEYSSEK